MTNLKIEVGDWGYCIGDRRIDNINWLKSFPQNWFGKVIIINGNNIIMRCYKAKNNYNKKHPHLKTEKKFFKKINK